MTRPPRRLRVPLPGVRRIAILRALQLGDLLVAVPALRAIRAGYPDAEITLIGLPWASSFATRFGAYLDRFVAFPGAAGIDEADYYAARTAAFLEHERVYGYDLVVQLHGSGRTSNAFCLALGGHATAGYFDPTLGLPEGMTFAAPYPADGSEVLRNLGIARLLGCPTDEPGASALEFPLTAEDHTAADELLAGLSHGGPLIAIHPGARAPARRWPAKRFAHVADELVRRLGARIVLTGGPGEEETARVVAEGMRAGLPLNLAGKTTIGSLAAVLARLDLFVGNDTGPAHLAEAVGTPTVRIFGPADPRRWGPLDQTRHRVVRVAAACSPCGYRECPIDHRCLRRIALRRVIAEALDLAEHLALEDAAEGLTAARPARAGADNACEESTHEEGDMAWSA